MKRKDGVSTCAVDVEDARQTVESAAERIQHARRNFMRLFGYGAAGVLATGISIGPDGLSERIGVAHAESEDPEDQKSAYGKAFRFSDGLLYMNIGTTGATPTRIIRNYNDDYKDIAQNPAAYFFGQQVMRNTVAPGFGCDPYELVFSFNTTDGLWRIVGGIPFQAGDEVITTNMEEDAGVSALNMLRDRYGVVIKTVNLPTHSAYSDDEVLRRFAAQLTGNSKAILFSCPIYLTGARLPAKALCQWAAAYNVISIVDGAHLPGMVALNLHDLGCDFFSGAGHKWQCGPGQTGFLYIRNGFNPLAQTISRPTSDYAPLGGASPTVEISIPGYTNTNPLPTYFPTNTLFYGSLPYLKQGQRNPDHNIAAILQLVGNGNRPSQKALTEVCQWWDRWGRSNIENYLVSLAQYLRARIATLWGPQSLSLPYEDPPAEAARTGLTSFNPFSPRFDYNAELSPSQAAAQNQQSAATVLTLKNHYGIVVRNNSVPHSLRDHPAQNAAPGTYSTPLRISTHLFHSTADVDRLIEALLAVVPSPV